MYAVTPFLVGYNVGEDMNTSFWYYSQSFSTSQNAKEGMIYNMPVIRIVHYSWAGFTSYKMLILVLFSWICVSYAAYTYSSTLSSNTSQIITILLSILLLFIVINSYCLISDTCFTLLNSIYGSWPCLFKHYWNRCVSTIGYCLYTLYRIHQVVSAIGWIVALIMYIRGYRIRIDHK